MAVNGTYFTTFLKREIKVIMKIAVIGSGISGISAAFNLQGPHRVTLFEEQDRLGGHTNTVITEDIDRTIRYIDTGFIVFNEKNYPLFNEFIKKLGIDRNPSNMSFSFHDEVNKTCYAGSFGGLFPNKKKMFEYRHWHTLLAIYRYSKKLSNGNVSASNSDSISEYLRALGCPNYVIEDYFLPIAAAIWSCTILSASKIPASTYVSFFNNHGLFRVKNRPSWQTISNGSIRYIESFKKSFNGEIRLNSKVTHINKSEESSSLTINGNQSEAFDRVIVATHADTAAKLVKKDFPNIHIILKSFKYTKNKVYLHTDQKFMPPVKRAWASWNVIRAHNSNESSATYMTYYMNKLQNISSKTKYFVTLNPPQIPEPTKTIYSTEYSHPVLDKTEMESFKVRQSINSHKAIKFCGAYTGYGFHEDGFRSGKEAADMINAEVII